MAHQTFDSYYRTRYPERWDRLEDALKKERTPVPFSDGLTQPYFLDEASILVAQTLEIEKGDTVLDMCAAPGGKSLVIASHLAQTGTLVSNDRSATRRGRLKKVLEDHLPSTVNIQVTGHDATRWGLYEKNRYDKILLDAPCSSERHVIVDSKAMKQWSPSRPRRLASQQFAMLCAALEAVKVGGLILYSTCAITDEEDEKVIARLFKKREGRFSLPQFTLRHSEPREYGKIILPDLSDGLGPLYCCLIRREK